MIVMQTRDRAIKPETWRKPILQLSRCNFSFGAFFIVWLQLIFINAHKYSSFYKNVAFHNLTSIKIYIIKNVNKNH